MNEDMNPWLSIWFRPRETIRHIVDTRGGWSVLALAMSTGVVSALMQVNRTALEPNLLSIVGIAVIALVGLVLGLASLYLAGWLYRWVGSWFGGQAKVQEVRAALAWAQVPTFAIFVLWLVIFLMSPAGGMISSDGHLTGQAGGLASWILITTVVVGRVWQLILTAHALGAVHRFSAWKEIGRAHV